MSTFLVNRSNLKREPSLNKDGQIACSLPPSLERDRAWPKESSPRDNDSIEDPSSQTTQQQKPYVPTVFTEEQWKAAAEANPKPLPVLETKHGYNATCTKNHSRGSITRLMKLIDFRSPSGKAMWSSTQSLQDVPESRELVTEDIAEDNPAPPLSLTNSPPQPIELANDEHKLSPEDRTTVDAFGRTKDTGSGASMMKPCFGRTTKKASLID